MRRYQFLGVVPDDDFAAVNDGNRGGQDAARFQVVARRRIGQQVVVLILNTVGRQKLLQRPAAESTRVGIDMDFADCRSHFALPRFPQGVRMGADGYGYGDGDWDWDASANAAAAPRRPIRRRGTSPTCAPQS